MDSAIGFLQRVPQAVQLGLIAIGALFVGSKVLSFLRLVLNTFVLSGVNVSFEPSALSLVPPDSY